MKVRSKALYQFLLENGVLDGTKEDIQLAKKEYRRRYQRENKRKRKMLKPPVSISFTHRELLDIKVKAKDSGMSYTDYIKQTVLASVQGEVMVHNRPMLEQILQRVGIAISLLQSNQDAFEYLLAAETDLSNYLKYKQNEFK